MFQTLTKLMKDERGFSTPEILIIGATLCVIALGAYTALEAPTSEAADTVGNKLNTSVETPGNW
jgi:hypothetical protein